MRNALRIIAFGLGLAAVTAWLATGAHRGWTMTEVPNNTVDEVTGLTGGPPIKKFVAGLDFLGAGLFIAGAMAGASLMFRKQKQTTNR